MNFFCIYNQFIIYLRNESVFRKCRTHKMHLSKTLTFKKYAHLDTIALVELAILTNLDTN